MDKATVQFRRSDNGEVIGEIVVEHGAVFVSKNFGKLADEEIDRVFEAFQKKNPDIVILPVKLSGN
jgi:hypothetical protein